MIRRRLAPLVALALLAIRGPFAPAPAIAAEAAAQDGGGIGADTPVATIKWDGALPALPRPLSGHVVGISGDTLIVAGGTDFPISLFQGGAKVWYDDVYALPPGASAWIHQTEKWPRPIGYAGVVSTSGGVIVAGGSDGQRNTADVWLMRWADGVVQREALPTLPSPVAMSGAAAIGRTIFIVGGQEAPDAKRALTTVWALDLAESPRRWRSIAPLPGPPRILPVVVSQAGRLIVASGAELIARADGTTGRRYLTDAFAWTPARGWQAIAAPPRPIVAAPAVAWGQSHVLVFGGDDGEHAERVQDLREAHPGLSRTLLAYHVITDTWAPIGTLSAGLVTTSAVRYGDRVTIVGGEDRPGHRVADVRTGTLAVTARVFTWIDYLIVAVYLAPLMLIGVYFSSANETTEDFFLGGRAVPWWAAALSIYGTQLSAITFLAIPAKAYAEDWTFFLANLCIVIVAPLVVWAYLPFFRGLTLSTAYEYLERRFNLTVRWLGSLAFIVLQGARMAIVLFLPALTLAAVTGIDMRVSILLMGVLCTVYTLQGGMHAVVWTDVLQVVVLIGAAFAALAVMVINVDGGLGALIGTAVAADKFHMFTWTWDLSVPSVLVVLIGNSLANLVPYTADQAVVQRYMTTRNERQAARAVWYQALLTVPTSVLFFGVGTALYGFYRAHPVLMNPAVQTDASFAWFIGQQLPAGLSGLVVSGVFAAAMSTLSGSINSIAAAIIYDFVLRLKPETPERRRMRLARWLSLVTGAIGTAGALVMTGWDIRSLWDLFLSSVGLFGGALAGVFALGIFSTRANGPGAVIGFVAGGLVLFLVQRYTNVHFFLYAGTGMLTCMLIGYAASWLFPAPTQSLDGLTFYTRRARQAQLELQTQTR